MAPYMEGVSMQPIVPQNKHEKIPEVVFTLNNQEIPNELETDKDAKELGEILAYGEAHYGQYRVEINEGIVTKIVGSMTRMEKELIPNASEELRGQAAQFVSEPTNEVLISILKKAHFDYQTLLASELTTEEKALEILKIILKIQTYPKVVEENRSNEIEFSGFENDPDTHDAKEFVSQVFGKELLQKCLISEICYFPEEIRLMVTTGADFALPITAYDEWKGAMPQIEKGRARALNFVPISTEAGDVHFPTPIHLYSFHDVKEYTSDYLSHLPDSEKMRILKLGTISHEVAHSVYEYMLDIDQRTMWASIVNLDGAPTEYAKKFEHDSGQYHDESFAESIRLKTTSPEYLAKMFPRIDQFLTEHFPEVKSING